MTETQPLPAGLQSGQLLERLPEGILILDADGHVCWANQAAARQLGCEPGELLGISQLDLPLIQSPVISNEALLTPVAHPETRLKVNISELTDAAGCGFRLITFVDVTDTLRAVKSRTLGMDGRDSTRIDPLTSLLTRKSILRELVSEVSRSRRYHNPLSILLLQPYSDAAAWNALDEAQREAILKATAGTLKEQLRWVDEAGCWDHDCLLLVLPETHAQAARQLADKISAEIPGDISIQCAVSEWRKGDDAQSLSARAEALLQETEDCSAVSG